MTNLRSFIILFVADSKVPESARVRLRGRLDMRYGGETGADAAPVDHAIHVLGLPLEDSLDASVGKVFHPAQHVVPGGFLDGPGPECNTLDPAGDVYVNALHIQVKG